ncbi:hypothetical protein L596_005085 [Steinernema carpocapsae]|uniref:Uncharacterized protein n=1 Tax=Steinernema carpocapsae TaxID=34508 RepID=A0A4U8V235_STECR|nr:hypothetical protein L596_005085 [Steinernema carpocapsae]
MRNTWFLPESLIFKSHFPSNPPALQIRIPAPVPMNANRAARIPFLKTNVLNLCGNRCEVVDKTLSAWTSSAQSKEQLDRKKIIWYCNWMSWKIDRSFEIVGRLQTDLVRFKKENLVADCFCENATEETSTEVFMARVDRVNLFFE